MGEPAPPTDQQARAALDAVSEGVVLLDRDWRFRYVNAAAEGLLERDASALLGASIDDVFPGWLDSPVTQHYLDAIDRGEPAVAERYSPAFQGWFEVDARPHADGLFVVIRDVTARRRQERLERLWGSVGAALGPVQGPTDVLRSVLRSVHRVLDTDVAELWVRDRPGQPFRLDLTEHRGTDPTTAFVDGSHGLELGEGSLVERAFAEGRAIVLHDLHDPSRFRRSELAAACGIGRVVAFPISVEATPDAVLCLLGPPPAPDGSTDDGDLELLREVHRDLVGRIDHHRRLHDLERLFSLSRDGMAVGRLDGYFARVNPRFGELLGRSEQELLSEPYYTFIHPDDLEASATAVAEHYEDHPVESFVNRYRTADGSYRVLSWRSRAVPEDGVAYGVARDVTEEHLDRAFEDAQRDVLRTILTSDDLEGTLDRIAQALEQRLGDVVVSVHLVEPDLERLVLAAAPSLTPELVEALAELGIGDGRSACGSAAATGEAVTIDDLATLERDAPYAEVARTNGLVSCWSVPFVGSDQQVLGTVAVFRTNRRQPDAKELRITGDLAHLLSLVVEGLETRRQLAESEERFRLLAAAISDAIWDWNVVTDSLWWSEGLRGTFGHDPEDLTTADAWLQRIHPDDRRRILAEVTRVIDRGERMWAAEYRFLRKDGSVAHVEDRGSVVRDRRGRALRMIGGMVDTTERRELEQQYLRAERMESVGTLASGVAHDLNNVLSPILLASDLLLAQELRDSQRDTIEMIRTSAHRGADMVRQVLTFARGLDGERSVTDLAAVVQEVHDVARDSLIPSSDIEVAVAADLRPVHGDATQLHQVLLNLVVNAVEAIPEGGRITIRADNLDVEAAGHDGPAGIGPGRYVAISVEDTGSGMEAEVEARAFDPFFTTKSSGSSSGLGLATSLAIVRSHQGRIDLQTDPGVGSRFTVYLPASAEPLPASAPPEPVELQRGDGALILLVDDEASVRAVTQHTLETYGYRVATASDGGEALRRFQRDPNVVDVLLTDIVMPVMDGVSLIEHVRALRPDLQVIAVSGLSDDGRLARATEAGAAATLRKPFDANTLLSIVAEVVADRLPDAADGVERR